MKALPWILVAGLALFGFYFAGEAITLSAEDVRNDRRIDSLTTANTSLQALADSLAIAASQHQQQGDSLASVPRIIYIEHADRLTRTASLDSLGLLLGADPFTAVPDTFIRDHEH